VVRDPTFYFTNPHALIGHVTTSRCHRSAVFDFSWRSAASSASTGNNLRVEEAEGHIAVKHLQPLVGALAYTRCASDSAAKGKDTASPLGTLPLTPDELEPTPGDRCDLTMAVFVNGPHRKDYTGQLGLVVPGDDRLRSRGTVVRAGDILAPHLRQRLLVELWGRNGGERVPRRRHRRHGDMHVDGMAPSRTR